MVHDQTIRELETRALAICAYGSPERLSPTTLDALLREAHALAGVALTLGYRRYGEAAYAVEVAVRRLQRDQPMDADAEQPVRSALVALGQRARALATEPVCYAGDLTEHALAAPDQPLAGCHLVFVDDCGVVAYQLRLAMLRAGAAHTEVITSLLRARRYLAQCSRVPNAVLIDYYVGCEYGSTLARWMREQPKFTSCRRLAYSGAARETIIADGPASLFHGFIQKPIGLADLAHAIAAALQEPQPE